MCTYGNGAERAIYCMCMHSNCLIQCTACVLLYYNGPYSATVWWQWVSGCFVHFYVVVLYLTLKQHMHSAATLKAAYTNMQCLVCVYSITSLFP